MKSVASLIVALALAGSPAMAGITITNGAYSVGIGRDGELWDPATGVGFRRLADGFDPLAQGARRDSWGVSLATDPGPWADQNLYGSNISGGSSLTPLGPDAATATSWTSPGLWQFNIDQTYVFVAPNIIRVSMTIHNLEPYPAFLYAQRNWNVDVAPTAEAENSVGPFGSAPGVFEVSTSGIERPDASIPYAINCLAGCNVLGDTGGGLKADLGYVPAQSSKRVDYYYGISQPGQSGYDLTRQAFGAGARMIVLTQSSENGGWPNLGGSSAFIGIDTVVPEPASWAMMITGFALVGIALRRRERLAAY